MISKFGLWFAGQSRPRERELAREAEAREHAALRHELDARDRRFAGEMELRRSDRRRLQFGRTLNEVAYVLRLADLMSVWCTGSSGSGKTRFLAYLFEQLVRLILAGVPIAVIALEFKGGESGLADLMLRTIAGIAMQLTPNERQLLFRSLTTMPFFSTGHYTTPWNLLAAIPTVDPLTQAGAIAETIESVIGRTMGALQSRSLMFALAIGIEFGLNLMELYWLLLDRARFAELGSQSRFPRARRFAQNFVNESRSSIDGILARLDLLLSPAVKAMVTQGPGLSPADWFRPGAITVVEGGNGPLGSEAPQEALAGILLGSISRAALAPERRTDALTIIFADEIQVAAKSPSNVAAIDAILTRGRSFRTFLVAANQASIHQLPPAIVASFEQNAIRVLGRSSMSEALAAAEHLPRSGRVTRPRAPGAPPPLGAPSFLSETEEARFRAVEVASFQQRFVIHDRRLADSRVVDVPPFDPTAWSAIDPEIADAVRRGRGGVLRSELESRSHEIEERAAAQFEGGSRRGGRATHVPDLPDAFGPHTARRGRRGEVP